MNVLIAAVCVKLLTLVNADRNVYLETISNILKGSPRKSGFSKFVETSETDEVIPILPGFYLEKPKDLSKSLFKNSRAWPDDIYAILEKEEEKRNKKKVVVSNEIRISEDEYLQGKVLKAVQDLQRFRASQNQESDKSFETRLIETENAQEQPVNKVLGRSFQSIYRIIDYKPKGKTKKPENTDLKKRQIFAELVRKILNENLNNRPYHRNVQYDYRYGKTVEESQSQEQLVGNILSALQNKEPTRESKTSPPSIGSEGYAVNNAKEETSEEHDGSSELLHIRRRHYDTTTDDSKESSSTSTSSDYDKNPGNPFTVHKDKYKQNWPYNHFMDGDHMNISPMAPQFGHLGPSGPELFFGRKWWYFNQDDYKPMS